ncbi:hypothetical protein WAX74_09115 [Psychrobacillus sp. FJAT-51614]|uniref:DISARM protein DrmE C-terminal domain-containing protein n=1 Tax=Psychrobacillus mangrovi TaxID=3117745 RepID=A0ABU8F456_9BACI
MLGYRKVNLGLANELYSSVVNVEFIKVEEDSIGQLIRALKNLKNYIKTYYEYDQVLIEETELFIRVCRKIVGSIRNYSTYFKENNDQVVKYFTLTKKAIYADLFKKNIMPIIDLIKVLRKQDHNAYIDTLNRMESRKQITGENTYLLTKHEILDKYIEVNESRIKVMNVKKFIEEGIFADHVIFVGTSSYFDRKFSEIFYGKHIIFLGYSCFENHLIKRESFSNLISRNDLINTIYKGVNIDKGFIGIDFKETFLTKDEKKTEEAVINQFKNAINVNLEEKVEVKLATISHRNYIFLPVGQKVNVINRESLKITQEKVRELNIGDLLVFRTQNASNLIREVADTIMGINSEKYRLSLEKWKKRLRFNVKKKGIKKVSMILRDRYEIEVAKENNVKNWMSSYSIKPSCLSELLKAFNFDLQDTEEIVNAANKIKSAHISAGHQISQALMNELDGNLESFIDENGFYTFESNEFEGASFNIEEIKKISNETYSIPENEALKIIKR